MSEQSGQERRHCCRDRDHDVLEVFAMVALAVISVVLSAVSVGLAVWDRLRRR
jgi:hypothetical protein